MKKTPSLLLPSLLGLTALILMVLITVSMKNKEVVAEKVRPATTGFAVVELFTSEGCSSCPPADKLVEKIQKEYADRQVYLLAYHVDYWDRLGWKDPFDNAAFTKLQYEYADKMNLNSVYTPQIVVNGKKEFVGSNESVLRSTLTDLLGRNVDVALELSNISKSQSKLSLNYETKGISGDFSIKIALVEKMASSKVTRGENSGKELSHVQIVHSIERFPLKSITTNVSLDIPRGKNAEEVVAFVQNNKTGEIVAAAKVAI